MPDCIAAGHPYCTWNSTNQTVFFTGDAEMSTLLIDHVMAAPQLGITRTVSQMAGTITNFAGDPIDPCDAYVGFPGGCPTGVVGVGIEGRKDIVAIKTLLQAAGIASLDQVAGTDNDLSNSTLRYTGTIIVINIEYSNYFADTGSANVSNVLYRYRVSAVRNAEYKAEGAVLPTGFGVTAPSRTVINHHGVRVVISFSGNVGWPDAQTTLINLTVSLSLLSVAVIILDTVALGCCPLRHVYRQFKERTTIDFSDLRKAQSKEELERAVKRFETDPHLVDAVPRVFEELMGKEKAWRSGRFTAAMAGPSEAGGGGGGEGGSGESSPGGYPSAPGGRGGRGGWGDKDADGGAQQAYSRDGTVSTTVYTLPSATAAAFAPSPVPIPNPLAAVMTAAGGPGGRPPAVADWGVRAGGPQAGLPGAVPGGGGSVQFQLPARSGV